MERPTVNAQTPTRLDKSLPPTAPDNTIYIERSPVRVPLNLTEWFSSKQLLAWIAEALESLQAQPPANAAAPDQNRALFLTVMTLAYGTQMFRSKDIEHACVQDPTFANLCQGKRPVAEELEHFRRANRAALQTLLGMVLCQAVAKKFSFSPDAFPAGFKRDLLIRAEERMDTARHMNTWDD